MLSKHDKIRLVVSIGLIVAFLFPEHPHLGLVANAVWLWGD